MVPGWAGGSRSSWWRGWLHGRTAVIDEGDLRLSPASPASCSSSSYSGTAAEGGLPGAADEDGEGSSSGSLSTGSGSSSHSGLTAVVAWLRLGLTAAYQHRTQPSTFPHTHYQPCNMTEDDGAGENKVSPSSLSNIYRPLCYLIVIINSGVVCWHAGREAGMQVM